MVKAKKNISVIVPIYNGEKYLRRCVDSILGQLGIDLQGLEVLLINDGSKDGSLKIADQYGSKHPGIVRVIDQKNSGVANTRNNGIKLAKGEYICFVDQDDWIDDDFLNTLHSYIDTHQLDVVGGGYRRPDKNGMIRQLTLPKGEGYSKYIIMAAWTKIHRADFLRKNNISFFDNSFGEDAVFTVKEISTTIKWKHINYVGYNWYYNESSVSNTSQQGLKDGDRSALIRLMSELMKVSHRSQEQALFQYFLLRTIVGYLLFSGRRASRTNFTSAYEAMFSNVEKHYPSLYKNRYLPFGPKGETFAARAAIATLISVRKLHLTRLFARIYCRG